MSQQTSFYKLLTISTLSFKHLFIVETFLYFSNIESIFHIFIWDWQIYEHFSSVLLLRCFLSLVSACFHRKTQTYKYIWSIRDESICLPTLLKISTKFAMYCTHVRVLYDKKNEILNSKFCPVTQDFTPMFIIWCSYLRFVSIEFSRDFISKANRKQGCILSVLRLCLSAQITKPIYQSTLNHSPYTTY